MKFVFILAEKAYFPVAWMCRQLAVSRSGFYGWLRRKPSERALRDQQLGLQIAAVHAEFRETYGSPRILNELSKAGEATSKKRVARLMFERGLTASPKRRHVRTTDSAHDLPIAPNLVARQFEVDAANKLWVADITYVRTWEGWLYLAVILDAFSRRVVGWAVADRMHTDLVLTALEIALKQRRPGAGLVHHSDRGSQYASQLHRETLTEAGAVCSMSRKGDCWDNAVAESFFGTIKTELIYRETWPTKARAIAAINEYIACFYNSRRSHSTLGYVSPMEYEVKHFAAKAA